MSKSTRIGQNGDCFTVLVEFVSTGTGGGTATGMGAGVGFLIGVAAVGSAMGLLSEVGVLF